MRPSLTVATLVLASSSAVWSSSAWSQTHDEAPPDPSAPSPAEPSPAEPSPAEPSPAEPSPAPPAPALEPPPPAPLPPSAPLPPPAGSPLTLTPLAPAPGAPTYTGDTMINDPLLLGIGIALTTVGAVGTVVGVAIAGNSDRTEPCYSGPCPNIEIGQRAAGLVVTFTSLGLLGAGIPMIAVGARSVPEVLAPGQSQLRIGPTSVAWVW